MREQIVLSQLYSKKKPAASAEFFYVITVADRSGKSQKTMRLNLVF